MVEYVGRPKIPIILWNHLSVPVRLRSEHLAYVFPMGAIFRAFYTYADAGGEYVPAIALFDDHRIVGVEVPG